MPSPFPGMNPYLEQPSVWTDFHSSFIIAARELIAAQISPAYFVRVEEHIYISELPGTEARADIGVLNSGTGSSFRSVGTATLPATDEVVIPAPAIDEERVLFMEVRSHDDKRLVTVIELLSRTNKYSGPGRQQYISRRNLLLNRDVNYIEIDLLRGGPRMPIGRLPQCDYYALVSRPVSRPKAEFWAIRLRDALPAIPISLQQDAPDAALELQTVVNRVYDAARYGGYIYEGEPEPALSPEDAGWAKQFVPVQP